jgi:negative regulator of sigma E activity
VLIVIIVVGVAAVVVPVTIVMVKRVNANKSSADEFEGLDEDEATKQRKLITQSTLPSANMTTELQTAP